MVSAKFGTQNFYVSPTTIYTPDGVSISEELDLEEKEVSGKKPTVKVKGIKLQGLSFELKLDVRFVDVQAKLYFWKNTLLKKKSEFFYLGSYLIGKFFLTKYDVKNIKINKNGEITSALISLSFSEDGAYANSRKIIFESTNKKAATVKASANTNTAAKKIRKGSTIKPKSGVRWYYTADGAIKKTGKSFGK